eukprot:CAMPEP_0113644762 /NCGR_PEP_ID=MMETSP0017_2-20120614/23566_1 /TAXON_ID=2856 /ORGANISM="Cylindrotheca closterium" /LENGTH=274 /DNA_ID=CAMNT_0000556405 /DNA_START=56 /DNA_END=880 /DNA_ORIENTATION=+ /assembly_acc=CAM_ASM_000147
MALPRLSISRKVKDHGDDWRYSKGRGDGIPSVIVCDPMKGLCAEEQKIGDEEEKVEEVQTVVECAAQAYNNEEHKSESVDGDSAKYSSLLMLLESDFGQDNQYGMQRLVTLANGEFVNSESKGSVAEALVFDVDTDSAERLRCSFLRHLNSEVLRLAAFRVLASTLELAKMQMRGTNAIKLDFTSTYWRGLLEVLGAYNKEVEEIERAEATLSIKCLRVLLSLDQTSTIEYHIRNTLLSYIQTAYHQACEANDRRLQREAKGMLSSLEIHWTQV